MKPDPIAPLSLCTNCDGLVRNVGGPAHGALQLGGATKLPGGLSAGVVFRYRCSRCGSAWLRAADSQSGLARWMADSGALRA
ncbi:hypothetical protein V4F39_04230 [Aquincola sp. MAHUQ-54]|uniref:Uncharacterized protein n=1 Tax=Aquincola agrisoli TaxID=3119538 RepID=A0AAW9PZ91_9BURK